MDGNETLDEPLDGDLEAGESTVVVGEGDHSVTIEDPVGANDRELDRAGDPDETTSTGEEDLEFKLTGRPKGADDELAFDPDAGGDDSEYSKNVRKRIQREERLKLEARSEAARLAAENAELRQRVAQADRAAKAAELDGKIVAAREKAKLAKADLDVDAEYDALQEMARLEGQKAAILGGAGGEGAKPADAGATSRRPPMKPMAQAWIDRNPWFRQNRTLTEAALRINRDLVQAGYDDSDQEFYRELNRRLKEETSPGQSRRSGRDRPRAPVEQSRGSAAPAAGSKNVVQLDRTDIANMRKFGLDPNNKAHLKEYAQQLRTERG